LQVARLVLENFRNYERVDVELAPRLNLVVGRNAQGKTNLLEAVYCLSGLGSPRSMDAAMVREGTDSALVHAQVRKGTRSIDVDLEIARGRASKALVNKTPVRGPKSLGEIVCAVFFGPDELSLVKGSPDGRRKFLDDLATKLKPAHHSLRREWERVLRQRNALLKSLPGRGRQSSSVDDTLQVWDEALCRVGATLAAVRLDALGRLVPYARKRYEEIAGGGGIDLTYTSSWLGPDGCAELVASPETIEERDLVESLRSALQSVRTREIERRMSLVGPQRDDAKVSLATERGWLDARTYASQGDQRTVALALKLAEYDLLLEALGEEPVLLLDDVFSELDPRRRTWLSDAIRPLGQSVLTSAEPGAAEAAGAERVIEVSDGRLRVHE
jgi:DNA replication and repair protein RecF